MIVEPKAKRKRKEKRKGGRSGCTFTLALVVVLVFLFLVILIKGPIVDKPIPSPVVVINLTPQVNPSLVPIIPTPEFTPTPLVSPHGQIAYVTLENGHIQIYAMAVNGSNRRRLVTEPQIPCKGPPYFPPFPDLGQSSVGHIVVSNQTIANWISIIDADSLSEHTLTDDCGIMFEPAMSPDGKLIAYGWTPNMNSTWQIHIMDADGTHKRNLTGSIGNNLQPFWMPDGKHIRFVSDRDGLQTSYVMDVDGSNVQRLPLTDEFSRKVPYPLWSPDGTHMAFSISEGKQVHIYIANADGSDAHAVTESEDEIAIWSGHSAWTTDSKSLLFIRKTPIPSGTPDFGTDGIWMINIDGTNLHQVLADPFVWSVAWLPLRAFN